MKGIPKLPPIADYVDETILEIVQGDPGITMPQLIACLRVVSPDTTRNRVKRLERFEFLTTKRVYGRVLIYPRNREMIE